MAITWQEVINRLGERCALIMHEGLQKGWWHEIDDNCEPIFWHQTFASDWEGKTMCHVMVHFKQFKSLTEARKAGWNKPVTPGEHKIKKRRFFLEVI